MATSLPARVAGAGHFTTMPSKFDSQPSEIEQMKTEVRLAECLHRLHSLRVSALTGGHYDPEQFDQAVLEFRRAWDASRQRTSQPQPDASRVERRVA